MTTISRFYDISERPLKRSDREARAETGAKRPLDVVQRLRRPAAPPPLRARAESAPASGRDERPVIGLVDFSEIHEESVCRDAELSAA
jgi:hypothetical protein